jgi:rhomboid protease GluP
MFSNRLIPSLGDPTFVIKALIGLNIAMFILSIILDPKGMRLSANPLLALSPSNNSLLLLGATGTLPIDQFQRWWTLLTANYLHGGIVHIVFNMLALRQLAGFVTREYGVYRFICIYTLAGLIGFIVSYIAGVAFTIGASAAVCGLIGATMYYGKARGGVYGNAIFRQVGGWVVGLFIIGLLLPGINNWGHGGGLLGGALTGWLVGYNERARQSLTHKLCATGLALLTVASLLWAVGSSVYYLWL